MDKELLDALLGEKKQQSENIKTDVNSKLDLINKKLDLLLTQRQKKMSWCVYLVTRGYFIYNGKFEARSDFLITFPLQNGKTVVALRDMIEVLQGYAKVYKERLHEKLPKRLIPVFEFLTQNGIMYLDNKDNIYKLVGQS